MSGICGVYDYMGYRPADPTVLGAMMEAIRHRGPDGEGSLVDGGLGLGVRRLGVIDLAHGDQPVYCEDGGVGVVLDGTIYNYRQLTHDMEAKGHKFGTLSDTEVIAHLYEEYGDECVDRLRGAFSFALWDRRERKLFIARDRLGAKPLYYTLQGNRLVFGSEIKAILKDTYVQKAADLGALATFMALGYVPGPETAFKDIKALPPGYAMSCTADEGVRQWRYWDISITPHESQVSDSERTDQLLHLVRESIRLALTSDVPLGALLDGGISSGIVVAMMSDLLDEPVKTYAVGGSGDEAASELTQARMIAERYSTDHHEVLVGGEQLPEVTEKVIWHLDQPIGDPSVVSAFFVSELAAKDARAVLSGDGGDELFAVHARYASERRARLFRAVPAFIKRGIVTRLGRRAVLGQRMTALRALCQPSELDRLVSWHSVLGDGVMSALLSPELLRQIDLRAPQTAFAGALEQAENPDALSQMQQIDIKLGLPDALLLPGDRMSMASAVDLRLPLLDRALVEYAAALPRRAKARGREAGHIWRQLAAGLLPEEVVGRTEPCRGLPIGQWYRTAAREYVHDLLSPTAVGNRGLFVPEFITRLLDRHDRGKADNGQLIWSLVSVELWHRLFIDGN